MDAARQTLTLSAVQACAVSHIRGVVIVFLSLSFTSWTAQDHL
jgi:hypothetical protein